MKFKQLKGRTAYLITTGHGIGDIEYVVLAKNREELDEFIKQEDIREGENCYSLNIRELGPDGMDIWQNSIYISRHWWFDLVSFIKHFV